MVDQATVKAVIGHLMARQSVLRRDREEVRRQQHGHAQRHTGGRSEPRSHAQMREGMNQTHRRDPDDAEAD